MDIECSGVERSLVECYCMSAYDSAKRREERKGGGKGGRERGRGRGK